jgi:DNA-binding beta-propeller fold protein YncE
VTEQAYPADTEHLNRPNGLFVDESDHLYVVEEMGARLVKYRISDGVDLLTIGIPAVNLTGNETLDHPKDAAVDSEGNIWIVDQHRAIQYDAAGSFQQELGSWWEASDNTHFHTPRGIAFDSAGRMYVSDAGNHRVQVYTFDAEGAPVYSSTIGVTGVAGDDDHHFDHPAKIAIDSRDRVYVADAHNFRVQRCIQTTDWTCTTFHGTGSQGDGSDELSWTFGLGLDGDGNVYIVDNGNARVKKCTPGGSCTTFSTGSEWPADVAVDSQGHIYVSHWYDTAVREYDSSGTYVGVFAGTSGVPYTADDTRLNAPSGIAVASDGSIYVAENQGYRLVKLNAAGTQQWTIGQAGIYGDSNDAFGDSWAGPEGNLAVDQEGHVYVPDTGNNRVQVFDAEGAYVTTMGMTGEAGGDNDHFHCPTGMTISPVNGDIYVADRCTDRVQVFDSDRNYKATLGETYEEGSDNAHFDSPGGVAVDPSGRIYVADINNHRVQVFNADLSYRETWGVTGECSSDFGHFCKPSHVAASADGQIYVVDQDNVRVQVFDSSGAYLTTLGGYWSSDPGQFQRARGIALDDTGNVYVTDCFNHTIQTFAPGVPGWEQVNLNGFGSPGNTCATTLATFQGALYVGTANDWDQGGELWRYDGGAWTSATAPGFGTVENEHLRGMTVFQDRLYVGTSNESGGEIWRSGDGGHWTPVVSEGFGNADNAEINRFAIFSDALYASTVNYATGAEVWRSTTGDPGSWTQVNIDGFGDADNGGAWDMIAFNGKLYVGTHNVDNGGEIWRTDGSTWGRVTEGFGDPDSSWVHSFAVFEGSLYVSTGNWADGGAIWRSSNGDPGEWTEVVSGGFDAPNVNDVIRLIGVHQGHLYAATSNWYTGEEIWRTANGTAWEQVNVDGFGDSNNYDPFWSNPSTVFEGSLYLGTCNEGHGGEVWREASYAVYLPITLRSFSTFVSPYEPNDAPTQAHGPLQPGVVYQAYPDDGEDWYVFDLSNTRDVTVEVSDFTGGDGRLMVYAENDTTNPVAGGYDGSGGPTMQVAPSSLPAGAYYVRVYTGGSTNATTLYRLRYHLGGVR